MDSGQLHRRGCDGNCRWGILEPANLAVLFELRKPVPNGVLIGKLMKRFIYTAGVTGAMQVATLVIMTKLAAS